jgi:hypothetical protein
MVLVQEAVVEVLAEPAAAFSLLKYSGMSPSLPVRASPLTAVSVETVERAATWPALEPAPALAVALLLAAAVAASSVFSTLVPTCSARSTVRVLPLPVGRLA